MGINGSIDCGHDRLEHLSSSQTPLKKPLEVPILILMRKKLTVAVVVVLVASTFIYSLPQDAALAAPLTQWTGTVENVVDGDTFDVRLTNDELQTIRIAGINTNETSHPANCWAAEATQRLEELVDGKTVVLKAQDPNSSALGRKIRHVFINGTNVAEQMLKEGYGVPLIFFTQEPDFAVAYLDAFWQANDAGLRINDPTGCGNGPQQSLEIDMVTVGDADGIDSENLNGEYVDIINRGASTLDLDGWALHDSAVDYYWFPAGTEIAPGSRLRVHVGSGTDSASDIYMGFADPIFSPIDGAYLLDPDEDLRAFDAWPCSGRCGPPTGELEIEEVIYDGPGNDDANPNVEQILIRNRGTSSVDFTDWRIDSPPYTLHIESGTIAPGGTATILIGTGSNGSGIYHWGKTSSILNNDGDLALLVTPHGDIQDCASWGTVDCSASPGNRADGTDLNGDGYDDLIAGAPGEAIGTKTGSGAANLIYGSLSSLKSGGNYLLRQGGSVLPGSAENGDAFGSTTAFGDFNGDGYVDLVIGSPTEDIGATSDSGMITIIPGGRFGPDTASAKNISQAGAVPGASEAGDMFGASVASGDFDGDGYSDLAIGLPGEDLGSTSNAGMVVVLYGSASGLILTGESYSQTGPIPGAAEPGDQFGTALATGDFDGDGYDELVVSTPFEDLGSTTDAGTVTVIPGSSSGLIDGNSYSLSQSGPVPGAAEAGDKFGLALAIGDIDGDSFDDLAVGVPGEDLGSTSNAGLVSVLYGSGTGLIIGGETFSQSGSYPGSPEPGDEFGAALEVADLDDDGFDDIVVGSPGENISGTSNNGVVIVVFTDSSGPNSVGSKMHNSTSWGTSMSADQALGASMRAGDFNGDGHFDVAIGAPGAVVSGKSAAGRVFVLEGTNSGSAAGAQWDQGPLAGSPEAGDLFGYFR